jgi:hypothetical protein
MIIQNIKIIPFSYEIITKKSHSIIFSNPCSLIEWDKKITIFNNVVEMDLLLFDEPIQSVHNESIPTNHYCVYEDDLNILMNPVPLKKDKKKIVIDLKKVNDYLNSDTQNNVHDTKIGELPMDDFTTMYNKPVDLLTFDNKPVDLLIFDNNSNCNLEDSGEDMLSGSDNNNVVVDGHDIIETYIHNRDVVKFSKDDHEYVEIEECILNVSNYDIHNMITIIDNTANKVVNIFEENIEWFFKTYVRKILKYENNKIIFQTQPMLKMFEKIRNIHNDDKFDNYEYIIFYLSKSRWNKLSSFNGFSYITENDDSLNKCLSKKVLSDKNFYCKKYKCIIDGIPTYFYYSVNKIQ